jgi:hypothetical protein
MPYQRTAALSFFFCSFVGFMMPENILHGMFFVIDLGHIFKPFLIGDDYTNIIKTLTLPDVHLSRDLSMICIRIYR